ncbi:hypothetical protein [Streptomyces sp. H39-C1]|uniref:hypothetical protein n=1 Tax=Streptomyces sp. H39-C1 TaxID=3004355 RepID=UPI0022B00BA0|nr:hypothetical protein [Streptomyces sp. H39-C1]MCZ4101079.1 hypothetical protein [Streptomyces sp. H39-C1]
MALDFDSRKAPRNHADLKRLVQAVRKASKADESLWLEWKGSLDLNPADRGDKSGRAHVARAIIGFANRLPDEAGRFAEGHGYLLVGVDHEHMPGVEQHDITELVRWIEPYVGEEIGWRPTYVEAEGETGTVAVLVVTVDPPRWGDAVHCMRKEAPHPKRDKSIPEAAVFIRGSEGTTRRAMARDLDALSRRLLHQPLSMDLELQVKAGAVGSLSCTEDEIKTWLKGEEKAALASLLAHQAKKPQRPPFNKFAYQPMPGLMEMRETRTPEQYLQAVRSYLDKCRDKLPKAIEEATGARLTPLALRLINLESTNLENMQVELYIPGNVLAIEVGSDTVADNERFPRSLPSRPYYGSVDRFPAAALLTSRYPTPWAAGGRRASIHIDNSGSARLQLPPVHLRPGRYVDLEPFVVVGAHDETGPITAEWSATCTNRDGNMAGSVTLPRAAPRPFYELFS